jgi:hypothetical protein
VKSIIWCNLPTLLVNIDLTQCAVGNRLSIPSDQISVATFRYIHIFSLPRIWFYIDFKNSGLPVTLYTVWVNEL